MVQYSFSLENFEIFILILVRVSCFVYIAPFYGMSNVPNQVKIGLSAMIALLVSGFADVSQVEYTGLIGCSHCFERGNYRVAYRTCCKRL